MTGERLIPLATVGAYFLLTLALAVVLRRQNDTIREYFVSGFKGTWWLVGAGAFMSSFSAFNFTGVAGIAYQAGWSVMIVLGANTLAFLLNAAVLAPWFRQLRAISAAQIVRQRFDATTHQVFAWLLVLTQTIFAAIQLYGLAIFSAAVFGYPTEAVVIVVGLIVVAYALTGGQWAVLATDFIQGLVLLGMTVLLAILCLVEVGGPLRLFELIREGGLATDYQVFDSGERFGGQFTLIWAAAMLIKSVTAFNSMTQAPRYFAVKTGADARKAALLTAGLTALGSILWVIPPITARLLYPEAVEAMAIAKPGEASYAVASTMLLPPMLGGLMVVAVFSATMSSMDTGLNRNAAVFTADIYPALCRFLGRPPGSEAGQLRLARAMTLLMGIVVVATAHRMASGSGGGVFQLGLTLSTMLGIPLTIPLLLNMFVHTSPVWAGLFAGGAALVPAVLGALSGTAFLSEIGQAMPFGGVVLQERWSFQAQVLASTSAGVGAYMFSTLAWPRATAAYRAQTDAFFKRMTTPVDFAREIGVDKDGMQYRVLGIASAVVGGGIVALLLLAGTWNWKVGLALLLVGGVPGLLGIVLLLAAGRAGGGAGGIGKPLMAKRRGI
ncbi:sodium:solute symporter family transporter [Ferruginivarius sediminum]|uniref:Sodium transporter n=1 Tax=Ferruginivarius sediminum TaxID=2661937 RepID=A0A369T987_9PROT|nr:hypothetical protein [Ferruginivarius sediminum]RDD61889.1 hypothetical protein DRB17_10380 [Ferruginivarius sediminum]